MERTRQAAAKLGFYEAVYIDPNSAWQFNAGIMPFKMNQGHGDTSKYWIITKESKNSMRCLRRDLAVGSMTTQT